MKKNGKTASIKLTNFQFCNIVKCNFFSDFKGKQVV